MKPTFIVVLMIAAPVLAQIPATVAGQPDIRHAVSWVEPHLPSVPLARCCVGLAYDTSTSSTVMFGGGNGDVAIPRIRYNDTWIWQNGWTQLFPATSPSPRSSVGTAYDPTTGTVVLFGGSDINGNRLDDTWTWDGSTWTRQFPSVSPPARDCSTQSMAYDAATESVVLFGGVDSQGKPLGDTWEWHGRAKTWAQSLPASSPGPRRAPLAYDAATSNIVLFGGDNGSGSEFYNDTWTWDGITWSQQSPPAAPSARAQHMLSYDDVIGKVVLFGGLNAQPLDDTWSWDGTTWSQRQTVTQPSPRQSSGMVFDPLNHGLVLFGGEAGIPFVNETWLFVPIRVR